ncbi:MAG: DUF3473 domain-containing protein [Candidatus Omnitrophica bacterium]|nr:DUF3473 domain-containing protein [Candidatus Omnitrophota bacterium]
MTQKEFISDVTPSLGILRNMTGKKIWGYRAPTWSIAKDVDWTMRTLKSIGLKYDSSIYPISKNIFTGHKKQRFAHDIIKDFKEFPPATFQFGGGSFPLSGGTFLRYWPVSFVRRNIEKMNHARQAAMIYFYPWEFYKDIPQKKIPAWKYAVQWGNVRCVRPKVECLLQNFKFLSIRDVLNLV